MRRALPLLAVLAVTALVAGCGAGAGQEGLDGQLERGWRAYSTGDFDAAIDLFNRAAGNANASVEQRYSALLGLATTQHLRTTPDLSAARKGYEELAKLGTVDARKQSALGMAQVDLTEGLTAEGQAKLVALIAEFPADREADEATIYLAASLVAPEADEKAPAGFVPAQEVRAERGAHALEDRLKAYPQNPLAPAMHIMLANCYIASGQMRAAVDHLIAAEKLGIAGVKTRSIVLWRVAHIAENELKDYDLAEDYYERYTRDFKRTVLYYRALKSLERVRALKAGGGT